MKKILIVLLSILLIFTCACEGTGKDVDDNTKNNGTIITNNSPYDEGESDSTISTELLGSNNGIEIYGANNLTFDLPMDGMMEVVLLIKNTNDFDIQIVQGSVVELNSSNFSGSITKYYNDFSGAAHPNGGDCLIEKNSEMTYIFDISLPNFNNQNADLEGDLVFKYDFNFNEYQNQTKVGNIEININSYLKYYGRDYRSDDDNRNATIKGKVVDINSNPISGVEIELKNMIDEGLDLIMTDANGEFELKVTAHKSVVSNMWHESVLRFKGDGYSEKNVLIYPKDGEVNEVTVTLLKEENQVNYVNTKIVDLGIQAYSYDTDSNNTVIAFTPFHSALKYNMIKDKLNINFSDFDGNILFTYKLNAETPYVSVSDDGKYVVITQAIDEGNEYSTYTIILNEKGENIYQTYFTQNVDTDKGMVEEITHSRCAEISHDNKYLVVGSDDGDFWFCDWQNDTILWTYKTHGQVRNIVFDDDNSILLVSSGDGYMYGFDISGNLLFKTNVGSWATDMELCDNYLVYTLKTGWGSLGCIDITNGEILWKYQTLARGSGLAISKDKKYVWWGNDVSSAYSCINNVVLDIKNGEIAYVLNCDSAQEAMYSGDGKYLVVKSAKRLQVYETENYSLLMNKTVIDGDGQNAASINQTVAVNYDASKIVVCFNNDERERTYGQAYYFELE